MGTDRSTDRRYSPANPGTGAPGRTSRGCTSQGPTSGNNGQVPVNPDCRHYVMQTTRAGEKVERCKIGANEPLPFACPEGCVFFEARRVSQAGWQVPRTDRR